MGRSISRSPSYRRRYSRSPARHIRRSRRDHRSRSPHSSSRRKSRSATPRRRRSRSPPLRRRRSRSPTPRRHKRQRSRSSSLSPLPKSPSPSLRTNEHKIALEKLRKEEEERKRMAEDSENQEYDPANDPNRKAKSDDPAWKYGFWPELTNKDMVQCILCGKRVRSGVKRLKQHLAGTTFGDVTKCPKATKEIREEMQAAMANKKRAPKFQLVDEGDEIQEIEATNVSSTAASNVPSSGTAAKRARASFFQTKKSQDTQLKDKKSIASMLRKSPEDVVEERHRKGPSQTTIEHRTKTKEDWERCADHISNFFYENGIPFNAALSRSYEVMIESIGQYGSGMRPPSYHELRVPQLEKAKKKTDELKKKHENAWTQYGCTLMSDGWNDKRGRHLINFLVNSPEGTFFLGSEDVSSQVQDATMLANLLEKRVETIGKDKVVQIVTDNASNFKAAGRILEARIPGLFWTPCAAHCIDLMLEDIGKLKEFQPTITKARRLTTFIYRHGRLLEAMRRKTKGRDLVRCGATRFATAFLTLQSIFQHKDALRQLFVCDDWMKSNLAPTEMGKKVYATVLSTKFWNSVSDCMKASHPLLIVLRIVDGDEKPAMADISAAMDLARNRIKESFQGGSQVIYNKVAKIINERWANQMDQKLYDAALFLNPGKFFTIKEKDLARAAKIRMMFNDVLEKMVHDDSLVGVISNQANNYQNVRGGFDGNNVVKHRTTMSPLDWWSCYGGLATDLWQFAIRIIGLCCSSSGCERNWSTFDFIHTKKRNRLEHKRLNDLVYVKYNRKMTTRFQKRRAEGKGSDPLVLEDLPWDNEWINVDGDLIDPDAGVWWNTVDVAVGASTDGRPLRGYSRRSRNVSSTSVPYDSDSDEVEEDSMVPMVLDDVDIEDNYGVSSPISNDHVEDEEGFKNFDFGDDYL